MLKTMMLNNRRLVVALALGVLCTGVGLLVQAGAGQTLQAAAAAPAEASATPLARTDVYGDALPPGAVARMGTIRWRHGDAIFFVAYLPNGNQVVSASQDGTIRVWELATGKELRRLGPGNRQGSPANRQGEQATRLLLWRQRAGHGV